MEDELKKPRSRRLKRGKLFIYNETESPAYLSSTTEPALLKKKLSPNSWARTLAAGRSVQ
jgi:hypothetical protein